MAIHAARKLAKKETAKISNSAAAIMLYDSVFFGRRSRLVNRRIVVGQIAAAHGVPLCQVKIGAIKSTYAIVKFGVVVWTYTDDVLHYVWSIMRSPQWLNMMSLSIPATIRQYDRVTTKLTLVVV